MSWLAGADQRGTARDSAPVIKTVDGLIEPIAARGLGQGLAVQSG